MQNKNYHVGLTENEFYYLIIVLKDKIIQLEDDLKDAELLDLKETIDNLNQDLNVYRMIYNKLKIMLIRFKNDDES